MADASPWESEEDKRWVSSCSKVCDVLISRCKDTTKTTKHSASVHRNTANPMEKPVNDEQYMRRCLRLATLGRYTAAPNPMVGAVVVFEDRIIGEGYHIRPGEGHAEVRALASIKPEDEHLLPQSTIYVSLEPCAHHGKTPPCADLIIRKQLRRCVIGCRDPFPQVNGGGIRKLRDAGIEVAVGILEEECLRLNAAFFTFHTLHRPYITLKWAQSTDGFIDRCRPEATPLQSHCTPALISSPRTQMLAHRLRAQNQAILIGRRTALQDNPSLTSRAWPGKNPIRCLLDPHAALPQSLAVFDGSIPTWHFITAEAQEKQLFSESEQGFSPSARLSSESTQPREAILTTADKERAGHPHFPVEQIVLSASAPLLPQVLKELHQRDIQSLLVEGGSHTLRAFIDAGLWDEIHIEQGTCRLGNGIPAPGIPVPSASHPQIHTHSTHFGHTFLHIARVP